MKYKIISWLLILFPAIGLTSENSREFAQYDSEKRILSLPEVGIDDAKIYYNETTKLHLGADGNWQIIELGERLINNFPVTGLPENYAPEYFKINRFYSERGVLIMPIVEVDREIAYRNVKIQLGSQWNLLSSQKELCNFTIEQAAQLKACMTLDEIENIVGCPGVLVARGSWTIIGQGYGSSYTWRDLSVALATSPEENIERAFEISSAKYGLYEYAGVCQ